MACKSSALITCGKMDGLFGLGISKKSFPFLIPARNRIWWHWFCYARCFQTTAASSGNTTNNCVSASHQIRLYLPCWKMLQTGWTHFDRFWWYSNHMPLTPIDHLRFLLPFPYLWMTRINWRINQYLPMNLDVHWFADNTNIKFFYSETTFFFGHFILLSLRIIRLPIQRQIPAPYCHRWSGHWIQHFFPRPFRWSSISSQLWERWVVVLPFF